MGSMKRNDIYYIGSQSDICTYFRRMTQTNPILKYLVETKSIKKVYNKTQAFEVKYRYIILPNPTLPLKMFYLIHIKCQSAPEILVRCNLCPSNLKIHQRLCSQNSSEFSSMSSPELLLLL